MKLPAITGTPNAYEKIVQIWLDTKGYITSTGKWFWIQENPNTSRGYKDIDILGIKENEVAVVSVSTCLNDKIRFTKTGEINKTMYKKNIEQFFDDAIKYLNLTPEYKWLVEKKIRKILFFFFGTNNEIRLNKLKEECLKKGVEIISIGDAALEIRNYISKFIVDDSTRSLKTESPEFTLLNLFINERRRKVSGLNKLFE